MGLPAKAWALFPSPYTIRDWEDGHRLQILWNKMFRFLILFLSTSSGHVSLLPPAAAGNQFFPCQIPVTEVKGPFSHLSTPRFPSPNIPTTPKLLLVLPLVPMSMRPLFTGKLRSFAKNCCCTIWQSVNFSVAWMFVRKQKLGGQTWTIYK